MFESRSTDPSPAIGLFAQGIVEIKHSLRPDSLNIYATPPLSLFISSSPEKILSRGEGKRGEEDKNV